MISVTTERRKLWGTKFGDFEPWVERFTDVWIWRINDVTTVEQEDIQLKKSPFEVLWFQKTCRRHHAVNHLNQKS